MKKQTSLLIPGALAILLAAGSCSRKIYVPVERVVVHRDSSRSAIVRTDTVMRIDSVVITRSGDTVYHTAWRLRERVSRNVDTVERVVHDTIFSTQTVEREAGNASRPGLMERLRRTASTLLSTIGIGLLIILIIRIVYHRITRRNT